ncbi:MAG: hypothetical protein LBL74_06215 [Bacteroidales bacterium]|jgi:hypothetical protein|nr:hypothetical protein [Bacteroidales bacterium]
MKKISLLLFSLSFSLYSFSQTYEDRDKIVNAIRQSVSENTLRKMKAIEEKAEMEGGRTFSLGITTYQDSTGLICKVDVIDRYNCLSKKEIKAIKKNIKDIGYMNIFFDECVMSKEMYFKMNKYHRYGTFIRVKSDIYKEYDEQ